MKVTIKGYGRVDYVSKKSGKQVKGWNVFILRDPIVSEYDRITGQVCESLYVPDTFNIHTLALGSDYNVVFNRYGGIDEIVAI